MEAELTHVRLLVENYQKCFRFYRDRLGLAVAWGDEETGYAEFEAGTVRLALFGRSDMAQVVGTTSLPGQAKAQDEVTVILRVDDVDRVYRELRDDNVVFLTEPQDRVEWQIRTAHFRDPAGNLLEINQPLSS